MAGETTYSGFTTVAAYVAAFMSPYFRTNVVMLNLLPAQNFRERSDTDPGSNALKFGKMGGLTMSVTSEAASATKVTYSETSVSITAQKAVTYVELTDEASLFGNGQSDLEFLTQDAGRAAADKFDLDSCALFSSFSANVVGTTGVTLTVANLKKAPIKVRLGKVSGPVVYVLHPTQIGDLQDNIITSAAPVWANDQTKLDILDGQPPLNTNGYKGMVLGVPVYETTNVPSINSGADWGGACISPQWAICAGLLGRFRTKIQPLAQTMTDGLAVAMYYNVAIWNDVAGAKIVSKQ